MASFVACTSPHCYDDCPHVNHPSRCVLEKLFATCVTIAKEEFFVCGNGPNILVGIYELATYEFGKINLPCDFSEISVFPQLQITVRGIIPMPQEKCILAFGANYLAWIGVEQLQDGGHVCQSRIASTRGVIVGGRRIGEKKIRVFYEDGGFETLEVAKKKKSIGITRKVAKKLKLQWAKITSMVVSGPIVLLGTSRGQVVSHLGKIYLKEDESKGAVRQMTVINEHIVLLLFQNKSLALLDLRYHALRSVIEGRFTAVESIFSKEYIMGGDLDGTIHCIKIMSKRAQMRLVNSSKCIFRDSITCMFPIQTASLVCITSLGSLFVVNRGGLVEAYVAFGCGSFGSSLARTSGNSWYFIKDKKLYSSEGKLTSKLEASVLHPNLTFTQLKYFRANDFEVVYAVGPSEMFIDLKNKQWHKKKRFVISHVQEGKRSVLFTVDHLLIQLDKEISICVMRKVGWKATAIVTLDTYSKATSFCKIETCSSSTVFIIGLQDGRLYFGKSDSNGESTTVMQLSLITTFHKDFVVAMHPTVDEGVFMLTAKARLHTYALLCYKESSLDEIDEKPLYDVYFQLEKCMSYKYVLGRGYDILVIDSCLYLIGFKQKMLNVYKLGDHQVLSVPSRGPRSSYLIYEESKSTIRVICDMGVGVISRTFLKTGRINVFSLKHTGTVSHIVASELSKEDCDVVGELVTGDCNGLVSLSLCTRGFNGPTLSYRNSHQLNGAISALCRNGHNVFAGTSTGQLAVFRIANRRFYRTFVVNFGVPVTNIDAEDSGTYPDDAACGEGAYVMLADGSVRTVLCRRDMTPHVVENSEPDARWENMKWHGREVSEFENAVCSLSKDGILYVNESLEKDIPLSSISVNPPQRYSYFKSIFLGNEELKGRLGTSPRISAFAAGYFNGLFLFAVFEEDEEDYRYFFADRIHKDEIIDFFFYKTPSVTTAGMWTVSTLDKAGLYVQRNLLCISKRMKLYGLPMKWYSPVRHPKAMALLEHRQEVIVVGTGLATMPLKSLAPPPPPPVK